MGPHASSDSVPVVRLSRSDLLGSSGALRAAATIWDMDLGGGHPSSLGGNPDRRRFRIAHALRSVEDALLLLDPPPAEGIEVRALQRVRDDLSILLRTVRGEQR